MLFQWSIAINAGSRFCYWSKMWLNNDQCRSMKININQYFSIKINANQCWIRGCYMISWLSSIDRHWSILRSIDLYWFSLINIDIYWSALVSMPQIWSGIDRYWLAMIIDTACPEISIAQKYCKVTGCSDFCNSAGDPSEQFSANKTSISMALSLMWI